MEEVPQRLSGLHNPASRATSRRRPDHQSGSIPRDFLRTAHGQGDLASDVWRRVFECAEASLRRRTGLHLHRIPATFTAGGSFGWAWGCYEVTHRVDAQAGRIIDTV